tara:strand:- start:431 stop:643 length:213 start_codon:yes stop_codon:yes gene_type:complete
MSTTFESRQARIKMKNIKKIFIESDNDKEVREHLERIDKNLHTMYEAINALSQMLGKHKETLDKLEEQKK